MADQDERQPTLAECENAIMRACLEEIADQDPWRLTGWSHVRAKRALEAVKAFAQGGKTGE